MGDGDELEKWSKVLAECSDPSKSETMRYHAAMALTNIFPLMFVKQTSPVIIEKSVIKDSLLISLHILTSNDEFIHMFIWCIILGCSCVSQLPKDVIKIYLSDFQPVQKCNTTAVR